MLRLPDKLTADSFLQSCWQKQPLLMPAALECIRPAITRNELGWLATLEDVESRLVFVDRSAGKTRYRAESGPFTDAYLQNLPKRDWTLLVHDVEKHLPAFRDLLQEIPFIPDWRIDDLMISFAAPGGGVGPHRDNYDVFLCQGIGVRNWRYTTFDVEDDPDASDDLKLLAEFEGGANHELSNGDVLYLPPGVAHWGTARRACMTYSIGMRAPTAADLAGVLHDTLQGFDTFYSDPDLGAEEAMPGRIAPRSIERARGLLPGRSDTDIAQALGRFSTRPKPALQPDSGTIEDAARMLTHLDKGGVLAVHGMARIAFDERKLFVNGECRALPGDVTALIGEICRERCLALPFEPEPELIELLAWMIQHGAFELPEDL